MAGLDNLLSDAKSNLSSLVEKPMAEQSRAMKGVDALEKLNASHQARYGNVTGPDDIPDRGGKVRTNTGKALKPGLTPGKSPSFDFLRGAQGIRRIQDKLSGQQKLGVDAGKRMVSRAVAAIAVLGLGTAGLAIALKMTPVVGWLAGVLDAKETAGPGVADFAGIDQDPNSVFPDDMKLSSGDGVYSLDSLVNLLDDLGEVLPEEGELTNQVERMNPYAPRGGSSMNRGMPAPRPRPRSTGADVMDAQDMIGGRQQGLTGLRPPTPQPRMASTPGPLATAPQAAPQARPPQTMRDNMGAPVARSAGPLPSAPQVGARPAGPAPMVGPPAPPMAGPTSAGQVSSINLPAPRRDPILAGGIKGGSTPRSTSPIGAQTEADVATGSVKTQGGEFYQFAKGSMDALEFREAFKRAKAAGLPDFPWRGRRYTTKLAGE
jgi:hypothetical protein